MSSKKEASSFVPLSSRSKAKVQIKKRKKKVKVEVEEPSQELKIAHMVSYGAQNSSYGELWSSK